MIKNILIPEKIKNYYIFPKRVVGLDIGKTHVTATQLYLSGKTVTIERCIDEKLETGPQLSHDEKVIQAIKNIVNELDHFDEIYSSISSSHVIFKSLKLPFTSYSKIKGVIGYEVEPLLPFSVADALIDFIVTQEIPEEKSSEVMVVAAQRAVIEQHVALFEQAGISPTKIVVDLLSLYALYKNIPAYENTKGSVVLVDIGFNVSRIAFIIDGRLAFVRTIPKGIFSQAREFAKLQSISQTEAAEVIMRFGIEKPDDPGHKESMEKVSATFWSDIKFTLQSFSSQLQEQVDIEKLLILGQGAKIAGISAFVTKFLGIQSQLFKVDSLIAKSNVNIKSALTIPSSSIISFSVAFPSQITDAFNLYKMGAGIRETSLLNKQLIASAVFMFLIFALLFVHQYVQVGTLAREYNASEKEAVAALHKKFVKSQDEDTLEGAVEEAEREIKEKERLFAFVGKDRFSFLKCLQSLFDTIDKDALGVTVEKLTISPSDEQMVLSAEVRDYKALKALVKDLKKNKMFRLEESPEKTKFKMNIKLSKNA